MSHDFFIRRTYALARSAVANGNHPFGALLVHQGDVVLEAENTVNTDRDCTCHAERNLVSLGCRHLAPDILAECVLYTSTEPCAMCCGAIYWSGIHTVVYGCSAVALGTVAGDDFLIPCREILSRGGHSIDVVGPLLETEGFAIHADFWPNLTHE